MNTFREVWTIFLFYSKLSLRSPIWVLVALFQPVCYLFFYAPLLEAFAEKAGFPHGEALIIFTPGLLVMVAFFGSMFVGFAMVDDLKSGVIERLRVTPINRFALLLGRSLRDAATLLAQSIIIILLALTMGLNISFVATFLTLTMMVFVGLFMAPISYGLALTLKTEDAVGSIINFFAQPMLLLSGVLIPLTFAPEWLKRMSLVNPLKYIVDSCREVFMGNLFNQTVLQGIVVLALLVILSLWWAKRAYNNAL